VPNYQVRIINGIPVASSIIVVHEFQMGDIEDPTVLAGFLIGEWERLAGFLIGEWESTAAGQWVKENSIGPLHWQSTHDMSYTGYRYCITARMTESNQVFFKLKFK
jgi:hypothetical protein